MKHTIEAKKKISEALKKQWKKGKRVSPMLGKKHSEETKRKMSKNNRRYWLGRDFPDDMKKKIGVGNKGKTITKEQRNKLSKALRGEKSYRWKGGITSKNEKIRKNIEMRLWREAVFARDNWTCKKCSKRNGEHHPHHILNFAEFPELRTSIENGITLCKECHKEFHKIFGFENNTKEQLDEFLKL